MPDGTDQKGRRIEIEADARHADILIKQFNFDEKTKGLDVPEDKLTEKDIIEDERAPGLGQEQASLFRSMTMRLAYMSVDRPDLSHAVKSLSSAMKNPRLGDWGRLKKVVRYLVKHPYMKRVFYPQEEDVGIEAFSGSDWAGDLRTRRSTSAR